MLVRLDGLAFFVCRSRVVYWIGTFNLREKTRKKGN
ncbi:hypothetical protein CEB3_c41760 [Peptococcaceae bacterium CEB3]|nr:hypothetical protein CEB3_c41760 [Peptococcaceae bacterium CEB3]